MINVTAGLRKVRSGDFQSPENTPANTVTALPGASPASSPRMSQHDLSQLLCEHRGANHIDLFNGDFQEGRCRFPGRNHRRVDAVTSRRP